MNFKLPFLKKEVKQWSISDFEVGSYLGKGKFGLVYQSTEKASGTRLALKVLSKSVIKEYNMTKQLRRELEIHSRLKHKHILNLFGYFHDEKHVYIALELITGGNLFSKLVKDEKRFPEKKAARYLFQLYSAVGYMHARNVIHRDLKLENILIDHHDDLKICDFGWSVHNISNTRETICGTIDYLAPEIVDHEPYDDSVDIWCLGILLYEMLYGITPFHSNSKEETCEKIRKGSMVFRDDVVKISPEAKDLISKVEKAIIQTYCQLLTQSKDERIKLEEIPLHSFFKKYLDDNGNIKV